MTSIETAIFWPLIMTLILMQFIGLTFFFVAGLKTTEIYAGFYEASGASILNYETLTLLPGPFPQAESVEQLETSAWPIFHWGLAVSDLTRELTSKVSP